MISETTASILIDGKWTTAQANDTFTATNPSTGEPLSEVCPVSTWADIDAALNAAVEAAGELRRLPYSRIANFLRQYTDRIEERGDEICTSAAEETGLPYAPRLRDAELPRTCNQLRQAADAAESRDWRQPIIDRENKICSVLEPIGPVAVFGPNNFPLAFNGISGGDFAAAIAAGNPVIAKAHPLHPTTSRLLAECANEARESAGLPAGSVQMVYAMDHADGLCLVSDSRIGASAFTGSRAGGMALKAAADAAGKPIYLEMSSINPVVILKGALEERGEALTGELITSALMGAGQFCTNPGLVLMQSGAATESFIAEVAAGYDTAPCGTLLGKAIEEGLIAGTRLLIDDGAQLVTGGKKADREGFAFCNTLLRVEAARFLSHFDTFQTELFGNATLIVVADSIEEIEGVLAGLEGNLTGSIYSANDDREDESYFRVARVLRPKVGRLLNDKMPTGVAVSPAMNHGGPFPATGHPLFTAVGIPESLKRFSVLACYDNVRPDRLPEILRGESV